MVETKRIPVGTKHVEGIVVTLLTKNIVILKGSKGYVMCGYLNLKAAAKFNDVAVKIVGVSSIEDALKSTVHSCTPAARRLGIAKGQPVREVVRIIA